MANAIDKQQVIDQINALTVDGEFSQGDVNYLINYLIANGDMTGSPRDMIQIRRGNKANLPNLAQGELAFTFDTKELYIGGTNGNVLVSENNDKYNVKNYGAKGDGITDDTSSIQSAINDASSTDVVYLPSGTYYITSALNINNSGVRLVGSGVDSTIIRVDSSFNMSALGVIVLSSGEPSASIEDLKIEFVQPDVNLLSSLIQYPPAIYAVSQPRFNINRIKIIKAIVGIDMTGNSGGASIEDLQMSMFSIGIKMDGSLDSVKLDKIHIWPFELSTNQTAIFYNVNTIGISSGRVDDLHLSNSLFFCGTAIKFYTGVSGFGSFGEITNVDFDAHNGINISAGNFVVSGCTFTVGYDGYKAINQTGGSLTCSGCTFQVGVLLNNPLIYVEGISGSSNGSVLILDGCIFNSMMFDVKHIEGITAGEIMVNNCHFRRYANIAYNNPTIHIGTGVRASVSHNRMFDKGTGTGKFIVVDSDDWHRIVYNTLIGWGADFPTAVVGIYSPQ